MAKVAFGTLPTTRMAYAPTRGARSDSVKSVDRLDTMKADVPANAKAYADTMSQIMYRLGH